MKTIGGVAIPGQWLTPDYIARKQAAWGQPDPHPQYQDCWECGQTYLKHHTCPTVTKRRKALEKRLQQVRERSTNP